MPDDQGNFLPGGFATRGRGGDLLHGHRLVTELGDWTAVVKEVSEDGETLVLRITVKKHDADPFWLEHAPSAGLRIEMRFGRKEMAGMAALISRAPLVIDATLRGA